MKNEKKQSKTLIPIAEGIWNGEKVAYRTDRFLVKFKSELTEEIEKFSNDFFKRDEKVKVLKVSKTGMVVFEVPIGTDIFEIIEQSKNDETIEWVGLDLIGNISIIPNDSQYNEQWGFPIINAEEAWDITTGSATGVLIAVVDTGISTDDSNQLNNDDLDVASRITFGRDRVNDDDLPRDDHSHGTHVAGTCGAETNNNGGVAGMNWTNPLYISKVFDSSGNGSISDAVDAFVEIVDFAVNANLLVVINLSAGWFSDSGTALKDACKYIDDNGMILCVATGNESSGNVRFPSKYSLDYDGVIAVGATDSSDNVAGFSNTGVEVTVVAPGDGILSTGLNNTFTYKSGTSMATPHVTGLVSLIWSVNQSLTNSQVRQILIDTAVKLGAGNFDNSWGFGRIDAFAAVQRAFGTVTPRTTSLNYIDVPENEERGLAIRFDVNSMTARNFEITTPLNLPLRIINTTAGVGNTATFDIVREVYLWITYKGTNDGDTIPPPPTSVTVRCIETNETWNVPITANTIARPTTAIMLCFDQSGSMDFASGIAGTKRIDILRYSANILMDVIQAGNGVGIVSFDQDAHDITIPTVGPLGEPTSNIFDPLQILRQNLKNTINGFTPNLSGSTAIGDGLERAQLRLNETGGYDNKAVIVLTDGQETDSKYIADVTDQINSRVFAIGLGKAENINPAALNSLTNNTGGYMLLTDELSTDTIFKLGKYFLQILAGVTNENVIVDPTDRLIIGEKVRIPFVLSETDISSDVILMLPAQEIIDLKIESPSGQIIDVYNFSLIPGIIYKPAQNVSFYRMSLPVAIGGGEQSGKWHAILQVDRDKVKKYYSNRKDYKEYSKFITHGIPYTLLVHSYSNLKMIATISQNSYEVGAKLNLKVAFTEYSIPLSKKVSVKAYLKNPDGSTEILNFVEDSNGKYSTQVKTNLSGIYEFVIKARGNTSRGTEFTREQVLTGCVWKGGDIPPPKTTQNNDDKVNLCELMSCILGSMDRNFRERLLKDGFDINQLEKCLKAKCSPRKNTVGVDKDFSKILDEFTKMKVLLDSK